MNKSVRLLFFLLFVFAGSSLYAQDLVVTQQNDSLNCKITKVTHELIHFNLIQDGELQNRMLMRSQVKAYEKGFYKFNALTGDSIYYLPDVYPRFRLAVNGGWSYRTAPTPKDLPNFIQDYVDDLKSGYSYSGDVSYFFTEQLAFGLVYSTHRSKAELKNVTATLPNGATATGDISDNVSIDFLAPYACVRMLSDNKLNSVYLSTGLGLMRYQNNYRLITDAVTATGITAGLSMDMGYDMKIGQALSVGVQLSLLAGALTQLHERNGTVTRTRQLQADERESLARIDLSVGFRLTK